MMNGTIRKQSDSEKYKRVLAAVRRDWRTLASVPENLKNDREIVFAAIKQDGQALYYASEELKGDREIVFAAIKQDGRALCCASEKLKNDREIVLAAVKQNGGALEYASKELKNDREIVLAAVKRAGQALFFTSEELKNDHGIVLTAVKQSGRALEYTSKELRNNREIVLTAVRQNGQTIQYASEELQNDPEIVRIAIKSNAYMIAQMPGKIRGDRDIMLAAVQRNGMALQYASQELKNDRNIVAAAVGQNWRAIRYAAQALQNNQDLAKTIRRQEKVQSSSNKQGLNFLWLNLDLPAKPDADDGSIRMPMPEEYIGNVRAAAKRHPRADINLWVDSRRLTEKQLVYLEAVAEDGLPNVHVRDLCDIPAYKGEELYSRTETKENWRGGYQGVVWLQVDAAKILISLQGDYDQSFFADLDHAHLDIESNDVQKMLQQHGLLIGGSGEHSHSMENQLWGFDRSRRQFFEDYYAEGLRISYEGQIAYNALHGMVHTALSNFENMPSERFCFPIGSIGLAHAEHPGHEWSKYKGRSAVSDTELSAIFNERSRKKPQPAAAASASPSAPPRSPGIGARN